MAEPIKKAGGETDRMNHRRKGVHHRRRRNGRRAGCSELWRPILSALVAVLMFGGSASQAADLAEKDFAGTWYDSENRAYRISNFDTGWLGLGVPSTIPLDPKDATYCITSYVGKFAQGKILLSCVPDNITVMNNNIPESVRHDMLAKGYEWRAEITPFRDNANQLILKLVLLNPKVTARKSGTGASSKYIIESKRDDFVVVSSQSLFRQKTIVLKINCYPKKCGM